MDNSEGITLNQNRTNEEISTKAKQGSSIGQIWKIPCMLSWSGVHAYRLQKSCEDQEGKEDRKHINFVAFLKLYSLTY